MAGIVNILTYDGQALFGQALNSKVLKFTSVKVGTSCYTGSDLTRMKSQAGAQMKDGTLAGECGVGGKSSVGNIMTVICTYKNTGYTGDSTIIKQLGIYAALFDKAQDVTPSTTPILFSYLSYGDYGSTVVPESVQSMSREFNIPFNFGSTESSLQIVPSGYVSSDQTVTSAKPNKLLYLNANSKLPASITGDACTLEGHSAEYFAISTHTHDTATSSSNGFMSASDKTNLDTTVQRVNQSVTTTSSPTFSNLTVNGYIDGAKFR